MLSKSIFSIMLPSQLGKSDNCSGWRDLPGSQAALMWGSSRTKMAQLCSLVEHPLLGLSGKKYWPDGELVLTQRSH